MSATLAEVGGPLLMSALPVMNGEEGRMAGEGGSLVPLSAPGPESRQNESFGRRKPIAAHAPISVRKNFAV